MAIVKMNKLVVVGLRKDKSKILKTIAKLGTIETYKSEFVTDHVPNAEQNLEKIEQIDRLLLRLSFCFTFFKEKEIRIKELVEKSKMINAKKDNVLLCYEDLENIIERKPLLLNVVEELEGINAQLLDLLQEKSRYINLLAELEPYSLLDIPFDQIKNTQHTFLEVGTIPSSNLKNCIDKLPKDVEFRYESGTKKTLVTVIGNLNNLEETISCLQLFGYTKCPFDNDCLARELSLRLVKKISDIDLQCRDLYLDINSKKVYVEGFKRLYDYYLIEKAKIEVVTQALNTDKTIIVSAYVGAPYSDITVKELEAVSPTVKAFVSDIGPNDEPPTMVKNNKFVTPFSEITSMFGVPNYKELDANPSLAIFYFIFFGMMFSDAGYGLLLAIACFAFVAFKKPVKHSGNMMIMFGFCGLSTVLWGILFGGWFGIETAVLQSSAIGRFLLSISWFNPLEEPLTMFGLSLGLGVLQIGTGFFLNGYKKIVKEKKILDGILNDFSWVTIFLGAGVSLLAMVFESSIVSNIGVFVVVIGVVMLIAGGAVGKKKVMSMFSGAFKNLYGGINVMSDILSYARLFGLGLATGVIGMVINMISGIIVGMLGPILGGIVAVVILIFGHLFNMGINLLGVYVHNSRLQFIEFFGKFYEGTGRTFKTIADSTKYVYLKDYNEILDTKK